MWQNLEHPAITYAMRFGRDEAEPVACCDQCGTDVFHGDDGFYVDGIPYCNECYMKMYNSVDEGETIVCSMCGKTIEDSYHVVYGENFCDDCLEVRSID